MEHLHGRHEGTHAHAVVGRPADFLGLVVHGVELADFVTVADIFEEGLDGGAVAANLEVRLLNAYLSLGRREKQIHGLGLVAIVGVVRN